jgi:hypothetical protein
MKTVFRTKHLNDNGVCLSLACEWVKAARMGLVITDESGFRSKLATFLNQNVIDVDKEWWKESLNTSEHSIRKIYHLPLKETIVQWSQLDVDSLESWFDENYFWGFCIIGLGGLSQGHAVAIWYGPERFMYFDSNIGCFEFSHAMEMFSWMKYDREGPAKRYTMFNRRVLLHVIPRIS